VICLKYAEDSAQHKRSKQSFSHSTSRVLRPRRLRLSRARLSSGVRSCACTPSRSRISS
jgi:hypothetical protein